MRTIGSGILLFLLASCSAASHSARSVPLASPAHSAAIAESRAAIAPLLDIYPGITAAAAVDGELLWSEGFGFADVENQRRATPATVFRLYSTSKSFAATLAMRMADQKLVDIDAPANRYLPDLPPAAGALTLRQLLGHRGGVRHYRPGEWMIVSQDRCARASAALAPFISDPLLSVPGEQFNYSSFGYVLASAILEAAANKPFYRLIEDEIFRPAGMHTAGAEHEAAPELLARPYGRDDSGLRIAPSSDASCKFGAGGLAGTSEDLLRFGVAVLDGTLVSRGSREAMFLPRETAAGRPGYGLGFVIEEDDELGTLATHSGGALGGRSFLLIAPRDRIVVALAGNFEGTPNLHDAAVAIARAFHRQ